MLRPRTYSVYMYLDFDLPTSCWRVAGAWKGVCVLFFCPRKVEHYPGGRGEIDGTCWWLVDLGYFSSRCSLLVGVFACYQLLVFACRGRSSPAVQSARAQLESIRAQRSWVQKWHELLILYLLDWADSDYCCIFLFVVGSFAPSIMCVVQYRLLNFNLSGEENCRVVGLELEHSSTCRLSLSIPLYAANNPQLWMCLGCRGGGRRSD